MQVINNFISEVEVFESIANEILSPNFPWFFSPTTGHMNDNSDFLFYHWLYDDGKQISAHFNNLLMPLLGRLRINSLIRSKVNLYTKKSKHIKTAFHTDQSDKHNVALFSINTNNGYTLFRNKKKAPSIQNTIYLFDGQLEHCSVAQTAKPYRINININYR